MTNEREANDEERVTKKGECSDGKMNLQGEISKFGNEEMGWRGVLGHKQ